MNTRVNSRSTEHTGNLTIPPNQNRSLFFIIQIVGTGTIEFGEGGGKIPLDEGVHYIPPAVPTDKIIIESTGTYVIHIAGQTL